VHNLALILVYSITLTLIIAIIISIFLRKKLFKFKLKKSEIKEKRKILNQLIFAKQQEVNDFLYGFFNYKNKHKYKTYFTFLNDNKYFVCNDFKIDNNNCDNLIYYIKKAEQLNCDKLYFFGNKFSDECYKIVKNFKTIKIKLVNFNDFYLDFIKKQNIKPNFNIKYEEKSSYNIKELLNIAFNKNKTKNYVFTGIIFLIGSIFLRYNIYYLVFTTLMFIFALLSYFNKRYNNPTTPF